MTQEQDSMRNDINDDKTAEAPDDAHLRCQIIQPAPGQFAVLVQLEGAEDQAWMVTMSDVLQMIQNPPGIMVPQAKKASDIELPPEKKIITN